MIWLSAIFLSTFSLLTGFIPVDTWSMEYKTYIMEYQKQMIIENYFDFADQFPKIRYARWCAWWYEPSGRCSDISFDCGWLMKAYLLINGIVDENDLPANSEALFELGTPKNPREWIRWDFMYRRWPTWNLATHFSVLSRDYTGGNSMRIYDNVKIWHPNWFGERELELSCWDTYCRYLGKYTIRIATNWAIDLVNKKWIIVFQPEEQTWNMMAIDMIGNRTTITMQVPLAI